MMEVILIYIFSPLVSIYPKFFGKMSLFWVFYVVIVSEPESGHGIVFFLSETVN